MTKKRAALYKRLLKMLADVVILGMGLYLAQMLWKSNPGHSLPGEERVWRYAPLFLAVYIAGLNIAGVYRIEWKYADMRDMLRLLFVCAVSTGVCLLLNVIFKLRYSRMVISVHGVFSLVLLVASRFVWLLIQNLMFADKTEKHVRRALIIGAGTQGAGLVKALSGVDDGARHEAVAYLDDDVDKLYRRINSLPVEGTSADIDKVIKSRHVDEVLFTSPLEKSENAMYVFLRAIAAGCSVSRYEAGALKTLKMNDMLDGGDETVFDLAMTYKHRIAIIGAGTLAREIAVLCSENGAGKVFALDSDPDRLAEMARAGAWVKLGNPAGERVLRDFLREAQARYVFYLSGVDDQEIIEGNEQAVVKLNIISPLNALRYASGVRATSFIYVTDTRGEPGGMRLFECAEAALCANAPENTAAAAVSVQGLLDDGGTLARMYQRAALGRSLSVHEGEKASFISCRSAAAALIAMAQTRCEGRFTVKGGVECDMLQLSQAVTRECASARKQRYRRMRPRRRSRSLKPDSNTFTGARTASILCRRLLRRCRLRVRKLKSAPAY